MNKQKTELGLTNRVQQIVLFAFQNPTLTQTEIAKHFGLSNARVSQIMTSKRVLEAFPRLAKAKVRSLVPKAVGRLESLMDQVDNLAVSEKVVSKILDHADVLTPQPQVVIHELRMKSVQELQQIIDEGKKLNGPVIDAEIIDEI